MTGCRYGRRRSAATVVMAALAGMACGSLSAQIGVDSVPNQTVYGGGVHAFFSGHMSRAYDDLTNAIEAGSKDPRVYYFRGLAALRMGRTDEAEADFTRGADLEADPGRQVFVDVARSLERVQGPDRLQLERHRVRARLVSQQQGRRAAKKRFLSTLDSQDEVLREPPAGAEDTRREVKKFGGEELPGGEPPAELPPLAAPADDARRMEPGDDATERDMGGPAERADRSEPPAEDPAADPAAEPAAEAVERPAEGPAAEMKDEAAAGADAGGDDTAAGSGELPAERDAAPAMEEKDGLGETEPFSP